MRSLREVYNEWAQSNPYMFQRSLMNSFSHIFEAFKEIADLPYDQIAGEMFEVVIEKVSSPRKQENLRYLIKALDRFLMERYGLMYVVRYGVSPSWIPVNISYPQRMTSVKTCPPR